MHSKFKKNRYTPLAALVASGALFAVGCSTMDTTATGTSEAFANSALMTGKVHGGNQPVGNATVQLFSVAFNGIGSGTPNGTTINGTAIAGNLLATTTTDASGEFSFSKQTSGTYANTGNQYVCPSGVDAPLYIKTVGGNTTGSGGTTLNNSAAVFLAPIGLCSQVTSSTYVNISEVTTAATVLALGQYINPTTEYIGADGIAVAAAAVVNSMNVVKNLVDPVSGNALTTVTIPGSSSGLQTSGVTMTATPESAKLNTVANILSACVNQASSTGTGCSTLFSNAAAPGTAAIARGSQPGSTYPAAADTLQAALYMFINPTDGSSTNRTNLYNLSPATGAPYQPTITAVPTDWTIAISYSAAGQCGTSSTNFFNQPSDLNNDASGNIWLSNNSSNGAVVEISNTGVPTACATLNGMGRAGGTIDSEGNVWFGATNGNFIYRLVVPSSTQAAAYGSYSVRQYTTAGPVQAITVDGSDNIFFSSIVGGQGMVYKITGGARASGINNPDAISGNVGTAPARLFPDSVGDIFVTSGAGYVTELQTSTASTAVGGYVATVINGLPSPTTGVVVGPANRVYITSGDPGASLSVLAPSTSGNGYGLLFSTAANTGGLSNPLGIWIDGGQTSYAANNTANSSTNLYALSLVALDGTEVSASGNTNGGYQKPLVYFNQMRNILVDQSGNVWVTNDGNASSITEVIGVGVPIYGGYAAGLTNGRFQSTT